MELRQLRYFVVIVDARSLSRAAMQLHIAQPALSQHIRHMEEELQVSLLDRTPRGVTPTDAGRRLYTAARTILAQAADLPEYVRSAVRNPVGDVRLGLSGTVSELVGVPLLESAREKYPGIRVRIVEGMSGHMLEGLRRNEVDVALVYATSDPEGVQVRHILTEDLCLFGPAGSGALTVKPGSAVRFTDIAGLDLIINGPTHGLRELIDEAAAANRTELHPVFEVDSYNHIKKLVRMGKGYGILPKTSVMAEIRAGVFDFWHIDNPPLRRGIYLAHSRERPQSSATRAISELCVAVTERLVREGTWLADIAPA